VVAVLSFGVLATAVAVAIASRSLDSVHSLVALVLAINVIAFVLAILGWEKSPAVGFSPLDLLMRFRPNPSVRILIGLMGVCIAFFGVAGILMA
jgi:hypothetical protein